jgi:glycosidase
MIDFQEHRQQSSPCRRLLIDWRIATARAPFCTSRHSNPPVYNHGHMKKSSSAPDSARPSSVAQLDFAPQGEVFPSPIEWRDHVLYQLLIDRFDNNQDGIPAYDPKTAPHGRDPKQADIFQGGKIKGITRRLDYIKDLGCSVVWISPPFKQRQDDPGSYHGYGAQDFLAIDPRFGTLEDLRELVSQAHQRGMYIILDIVVNHTGDVWSYADSPSPDYNPDGPYPFGQWHKISQGKELGPDDAVWPVELQDPDCFSRRGHIGDIGSCSGDECIRGDFFSLKDLNTDNPKTLDTLIRIYKYWIAATDIDGYRIDTVKHVDPSAMATFCNAMHEYATSIGKKNFLIFGEIAGGDDLLHEYVGGNRPTIVGGVRYPNFDAVLDFPLYSVLDEVLKKQKPYLDLRNRYENFQHYFRDYSQASKYYITFVDNHDQPGRSGRRFLAGTEDPQMAVLAMGYLMCNVGIPCIYYGTEQGFNGSGETDGAVREAMFGGKWGAFDTTGVQFFNPDHPIYKAIASIGAVRRDQMALRYGRQYFRQTSSDGKNFGWGPEVKNILAFSRVLDTQEVLVALNLDAESREQYIITDGLLTPAGSKMTDLLNGGEPHPVLKVPHDGGAAVKVTMAPHSVAILKMI